MAHSSLPSEAGQLMLELADGKQVTAQALSFWRFPRVARGCAAGAGSPECPKSATFSARAVSFLRLACG